MATSVASSNLLAMTLIEQLLTLTKKTRPASRQGMKEKGSGTARTQSQKPKY
jgi:hypothetical protein